jgi:hypothetical protein
MLPLVADAHTGHTQYTNVNAGCSAVCRLSGSASTCASVTCEALVNPRTAFVLTLATTNMKTKIIYSTILLYILKTTVAFGQVSRSDLLGEWITNNNDSLYFKSDTLELHEDINYRYSINTCHLIKWLINKRSFQEYSIFTCSEPGREFYSNTKESLSIKQKGNLQIIEIRKGKFIKSQYLILEYQESRVDRYPYDVKKLKLKRI